ncbi:MAG: hypothetical protein IPM54_06250 [Polyangiaceae bacterium]|nr:hypothetical protein [Polyangiaceae bacterium]
MKNLTVMLGRTLVATMFVVATPAWGQEAPLTPAQTLFESGREASNAGRWPDAIRMFSESYKLEPTPRTAAWLGRAQVESGDYVAGAANLELYLREEKEPSEKMKQSVTKTLARAKEKVVTVELVINQPDAEVFVDKQPVEPKRVTWPIYLLPGGHSFEVKKAGFTPRVFSGNYAVGQSARLPVTLDPEPKKAEPGHGDKPAGWAPEAKVGFAVAGGLGAVAVGTGIGALATYFAARDAYPEGGKCNRQQDPACGQDYEKLDGPLQGLTLTMTVSGALAAGALVYAAMRPRNGERQSGSTNTGLMVVPTVGGMMVLGTF